MSSHFKCGSNNPVTKTSKKMLKEKIRMVKSKNSELISELKNLKQRITFLEEKDRARNHSVSSEFEADHIIMDL